MKKALLIVTGFLIFIACRKNDSKTEPVTETQVANEGLRTCASAEMLEDEIKKDPNRANYLDALERKIQSYPGRQTMNQRGSGILYLPVVIHIVMIDTSVITNADILSQVQVWNADFNKNNTELAAPSVYLAGYPLSSVANCQIEFYVSNVVRVVTTVTEFPVGTTMKTSSTGGSDPIDPANKFNVWVCNTPGGLSWATFPGGNVLIDGIVVDYSFFGTRNSYYKGRVATHETGHWLNLRHIWGDKKCGDDLVNDTPEHNASNSGCPAVGFKSTCRNKPLMMWMNYMDYSYGMCTYMFTTGQKQRMDATIDNARSAYFSATKLYPDYF